MQTKAHDLTQSRWAQIVGSFILVLLLAAGVAMAASSVDRQWFEQLISPDGANAEAASTPDLLPTQAVLVEPVTEPVATPEPSPTPKHPLTLVWSRVYSHVNLRQEPGGEIIRQLENGSPVLVAETKTVQDTDWVRVLVFNGEEDLEGWVAASLVFTVPSDLPSAQITGEGGANLRAFPGGELVTWLPYGSPLQILETTELDGIVWAHVLLPDERSGWVAQRLLHTGKP